MEGAVVWLFWLCPERAQAAALGVQTRFAQASECSVSVCHVCGRRLLSISYVSSTAPLAVSAASLQRMFDPALKPPLRPPAGVASTNTNPSKRTRFCIVSQATRCRCDARRHPLGPPRAHWHFARRGRHAGERRDVVVSIVQVIRAQNCTCYCTCYTCYCTCYCNPIGSRTHP